MPNIPSHTSHSDKGPDPTVESSGRADYARRRSNSELNSLTLVSLCVRSTGMESIWNIASLIAIASALAAGGSALFAWHQVKQTIKSRDFDIILRLSERHMEDRMRRIRGDLLYGDKYDALLADPTMDRHSTHALRDELHKLIGFYEEVGIAEHRGLVDTDLTETIFLESIPRCYCKCADYISKHRKVQRNFALHFEKLAAKYKP